MAASDSSSNAETLNEKQNQESPTKKGDLEKAQTGSQTSTSAADSNASEIQTTRTTDTNGIDSQGSRRRAGTGGSRSKDADIKLPTVEMMEKMLCGIRGHLVIWPTEWLIEENEKWLFTLDKVQPVEIYD